MSINVVEASATPNDYIRVAATVTDGSSRINKVYAFAHASPLTTAQKDNVTDILNFIAANPDAVVTMFNPTSGDTTSSPPPPSFEVIGFVRNVITSDISIISPSSAVLAAVNASNTYHVYIVTQNNLGYNQVWESTST